MELHTNASAEEGKPGKSAEQAVVWPCLLPAEIGAMTSEGQERWQACHYLLRSGPV